MSTFSRPFPVKQIQCLSDACYTFTSRTLGDLTAIAALSVPHDPTMRPACSWRSVFIDSAHTFWPVPHVELLLIIMARYHLNVLHWRLANDTAWRIPIPSFHLLTGAGAQAPRPATDGHATSLRLGGGLAHPPHCAHGFYSEADIRHLVTYAAARDIRIIPEISFPPRTDAPIRAYPTYRCPDPRLSHDEQPEPRPLPPTHTGETAPRPHTTPHRSSRRTSSTHDCRRPCQPNDYEESKPSSTPPGSRVQTRPSSTYSPTSSSPPRPHGMDQSHYRGSSSPL